MPDFLPVDLTGEETRLAEDMAHLLDFFGRVASAVERGQWSYGAEKAGQLKKAADTLVKHLDMAASGNVHPRPAPVDAGIRQEARHYWLGRLLYPVDAAGREALALYQASVTPDRAW